MKEYNFFKTYGHRPSEEQTLDTQLFYRNSPEIYARFDEWKDNERLLLKAGATVAGTAMREFADGVKELLC